MTTSKSFISREQFEELKDAYGSLLDGSEGMWKFKNSGVPFDKEGERSRFSSSLISEAIKKLDEELTEIYGS